MKGGGLVFDESALQPRYHMILDMLRSQQANLNTDVFKYYERIVLKKDERIRSLYMYNICLPKKRSDFPNNADIPDDVVTIPNCYDVVGKVVEDFKKTTAYGIFHVDDLAFTFNFERKSLASRSLSRCFGALGDPAKKYNGLWKDVCNQNSDVPLLAMMYIYILEDRVIDYYHTQLNKELRSLIPTEVAEILPGLEQAMKNVNEQVGGFIGIEIGGVGIAIMVLLIILLVIICFTADGLTCLAAARVFGGGGIFGWGKTEQQKVEEKEQKTEEKKEKTLNKLVDFLIRVFASFEIDETVFLNVITSSRKSWSIPKLWYITKLFKKKTGSTLAGEQLVYKVNRVIDELLLKSNSSNSLVLSQDDRDTLITIKERVKQKLTPHQSNALEQAAGNNTGKATTYFVLKGRRYKVHKEGRKHIIKTTNGIIALTEAKKLQSKYLKEKTTKHEMMFTKKLH